MYELYIYCLKRAGAKYNTQLAVLIHGDKTAWMIYEAEPFVITHKPRLLNDIDLSTLLYHQKAQKYPYITLRQDYVRDLRGGGNRTGIHPLVISSLVDLLTEKEVGSAIDLNGEFMGINSDTWGVFL